MYGHLTLGAQLEPRAREERERERGVWGICGDREEWGSRGEHARVHVPEHVMLDHVATRGPWLHSCVSHCLCLTDHALLYNHWILSLTFWDSMLLSHIKRASFSHAQMHKLLPHARVNLRLLRNNAINRAMELAKNTTLVPDLCGQIFFFFDLV